MFVGPLHAGAAAPRHLGFEATSSPAWPCDAAPRSPDELAAHGLLGQLPARSPEGEGEEAKQQAAARNCRDGPEGHKAVPCNGKGAGGNRVAAVAGRERGRRL